MWSFKALRTTFSSSALTFECSELFLLQHMEQSHHRQAISFIPFGYCASHGDPLVFLGCGEKGAFSTFLTAARGARCPQKQLSKPSPGFVSDSERQWIWDRSRSQSCRCLRKAGRRLLLWGTGPQPALWDNMRMTFTRDCKQMVQSRKLLKAATLERKEECRKGPPKK